MTAAPAVTPDFHTGGNCRLDCLAPYNSAQRASTETINVPLLRLDYAHITSADCRVDRRGVRIKPLSRVAARVPPRKSCGRAVVARLKHELARVLPPVKARARQPRGFSCARLGSWPESLCKNEAAGEAKIMGKRGNEQVDVLIRAIVEILFVGRDEGEPIVQEVRQKEGAEHPPCLPLN